MKKIIIIFFISILTNNLTFAYEPLELSDSIKQAKDEAKMLQLKSMDENYLKQIKNQNNTSEKIAYEKISSKEITSK